MNTWIQRIAAFGAAMLLTATVAGAAPVDQRTIQSAQTAGKAFEIGASVKSGAVAQKQIVVAQNRGRGRARGGNRGGRRVSKGAVGAAITLGILGAVAASQAARSEPRYRGRDSHWRQCRRYERSCDNGSNWACRKFNREC